MDLISVLPIIFQLSPLSLKKANRSDHLADYLDLTFIIDSGGKLSTRLYVKRDPATYHLALLMVCTFHSSLDMHDAVHTMMISDIATSAWFIDSDTTKGI